MSNMTRTRMTELAHGLAAALAGVLMLSAIPASAETPAALVYDATSVAQANDGRVPVGLARGAVAAAAQRGTRDAVAFTSTEGVPRAEPVSVTRTQDEAPSSDPSFK